MTCDTTELCVRAIGEGDVSQPRRRRLRREDIGIAAVVQMVDVGPALGVQSVRKKRKIQKRGEKIKINKVREGGEGDGDGMRTRGRRDMVCTYQGRGRNQSRCLRLKKEVSGLDLW